MPNWVENTLRVTKGDPKEVFEFIGSEELLVDFNKVVPMPPLVMPVEAKWYEWWLIRDTWNRDHWGTKWNACDAVKLHENTIYFLTAWNAPEPVFWSLARRFPDHKIVVYSDEEIGLFNVTFTLKNGEVEERARTTRHREARKAAAA